MYIEFGIQRQYFIIGLLMLGDNECGDNIVLPHSHPGSLVASLHVLASNFAVIHATVCIP